MAPLVGNDIFSVNAKQGSTSSSLHKTVEAPRSSASQLLRKLTCESPTAVRRSPKKANRLMVEKGVGTTKMKQAGSKTPETPTKCRFKVAEGMSITMPVCDPESAASSAKDIRLRLASSQSSFWEGDDLLEQGLCEMDDREVDRMLDASAENRRVENLSSASSGSNPSSITSGSTMATSVTSHSQEKTDLCRKRLSGFEADYPCRRAKPSSDRGDACATSRKSDNESPGFQPCARSMTVSAAHQRTSTAARPLLRNVRDPGPSAPVTSTSKLTVSTVEVNHPASPTKLSTTVQIVGHNAIQPKVGVEAKEDKTRVTVKSPVMSPDSSKTRSHGSAIFAKRTTDVAQAKASGDQTPTYSPIIVAHDPDKQRLLDYEGIAKGVQFEIARGVTQGWWTWEDVTEGVVKQLRGTCFEKAGKVAEALGSQSKERLSRSVIATRQAIYAELDREQAAFVENKGRGLGLQGTWKGKENWYGGRIQLTCKLEFKKNAAKGELPFSLCLNSFGAGKSNRAARRVTSLSILQVKFEKEALFDGEKFEVVKELLNKDLIICGRRYEAFCTKESKVFFVETRKDFEREATKSTGDHLRLSYHRFIELINPLEANKHQAMNKWLARWQLILSTSQPVVEFQPDDIYLDIEDVYGDGGNQNTESIMTDGCGWINLTALRMIAAITNSTCPVVVQGRIAGAKGLWILHPSPEHRVDTEPPKIWIRKSQLKIRLPEKTKWDRSLRIFDLVRLPRLTVPSGLNMQTIMNMSDRGVKDEVFINLMEFGLKKEVEALTRWEGENSCVLLAKAVEDAGGIMASRRSRAAGADARLYNYVRDEGDDDDNNTLAVGGLSERDPFSGSSSSLYESAHDMLLAGFSPLENAVLRDKLKHILTQTTKAYLEKFHIPVNSSAEAFIAPDPYGVLEEGEVYFRCSVPIGDPTVCIDPHTFTGPVLVSRNPTRVASDIQKVTAVSNDRLLSYTDVIIFSVKGKRSLASYLGGGDYDGDTVSIFAEPTLVESFRNSEHIPEPPEVRESFHQQVEKVSEFLDLVKAPMTRDERYFEVKKRVLSGLSDGKVGLYSMMHDCAIYELGYNAKTTIRLAYMFTTCLDAVKSGLRIKDEVFKADSRKWNIDRPACMQTAEETSKIQMRDRAGRYLYRPKDLGPFVLETLRKAAKDLGDQALSDFEKLSDDAESSNPLSRQDDDLSGPYNELKAYANDLKIKGCTTSLLEDLGKIEVFVRTLCDDFIAEVGPLFGNRSPRKNSGNDTTTKSKSFARISYEYARRFGEGPPESLLMAPRLVKEAKASYAYVYGNTKSKLGRGFGFAVAFDALCALKIQQRGGGSLSRECRDYALVSNSLVKAIRDE